MLGGLSGDAEVVADRCPALACLACAGDGGGEGVSAAMACWWASVTQASTSRAGLGGSRTAGCPLPRVERRV